MASHRQTAANRRNAEKSTGPRSPEGKARSRQNALTHGLTAQYALLPDEDPAEFDAFCEAMLISLAPEGPLEHQLVERATSLIWRLRRIPAFEVALIEWIKQLKGRSTDHDGCRKSDSLASISDSTDADRYSTASREVLELGRAFNWLLCADVTGKLGRYETDLQRHLSLTLKELREVKASRPDISKLIEAPMEGLASAPAMLS